MRSMDIMSESNNLSNTQRIQNLSADYLHGMISDGYVLYIH